MTKLYKAASFTDIHFGAKTNSEQHNQDCLNFIKWFCEQVKKDSDIDHIVFMGDWFENRSALNVMTLNYSYQGAKILNDLGLPIYFLIGNHDLYLRHSRDLYSPINFHEFTNFRIIDKPTLVDEISDTGAFLTPYLFHEEYSDLAQWLHIPTWWGHFEFKGFVVTGYDIRMTSGPDPDNFKNGPKRIFSGHFHKRQIEKNIIYIGNAFPTNYSDAGDFDRGMAIYDHKSDDLKFINWEDCPKYVKAKLSSILDKKVSIPSNSRVKCEVDVPINFEESTEIRTKFIEDLGLREFGMEESSELTTSITDTETVTEIDGLDTIDEMVITMLGSIETDHIDNELLVKIYRDLR